MWWLWRWSGHDCLRWCEGRATLRWLVNAENLPITGGVFPSTKKNLQTAGVPVGPQPRRELCCTSKFLYGPPIDLPLGIRPPPLPIPLPGQKEGKEEEVRAHRLAGWLGSIGQPSSLTQRGS